MSTPKNWTGERLETTIFNETSIEHLHRYAIAASRVSNKKVLDIACGEGYGSNILARYASHVTGVDSNAAVISQASKKYNQKNLTFLTGTAEQIPVADQQFDIVVSFETLEHLAAQEKMMAEIKRVLVPGGVLIISTPDKKNYSDKRNHINPFHVKELYRGEFTALLTAYFKEVQLLNQQMSFSSVITSADKDGLEIFEGNYQAVGPVEEVEALYLIALASDSELEKLPSSLFNGQSVFEEAVLAREKMVIGTITYRLGHALLYPAKLLRKLFNNNR